MAAEAAKKVFMNAWAAWSLAASAEPALKPNQPNHRMPVPRSVNGRLCGGMALVRVAPALADHATMTRAAMPALMWIAVPPAKSRAPRLTSQPWGRTPSGRPASTPAPTRGR